MPNRTIQCRPIDAQFLSTLLISSTIPGKLKAANKDFATLCFFRIKMSYDNANPESNGGDFSSVNPSRSAKRDTKHDKGFDCPICGRKFRRSETQAMPFCSSRCRQVDLARWFNESYGLPYEGEETAEESEPHQDD